jgi:hypothetical protein
MQLSYLFVAVSLDGRIMGVRFNEGEDGEGLEAQPYRWQSEFARYHAHAPQRHDYRCYGVTCVLLSGPGQVRFRYS